MSARIALVSFDAVVAGTLNTFSYSVHKLKASLTSWPELGDAEICVINRESNDPEDFLAPLMEFQPTLIGASLYVWSLAPFREVAATYKKFAPEVPIVVGGPSARRNVFDLAPYHSFRETVDAIVVGEGEEVIRQLVEHHQNDDWQSKIPGLLTWDGSDWTSTEEAERPVVDRYPSPYHLDSAPKGSGFIETFRGCPINCSFCQWGGVPLGGVHSAEYIANHLEGLRRADVENVFFLDAAFNLSPRAFRNLLEADKEVNALKDFTVFGHLYPTLVKDMHLELFARCGKVHPAIGIQSFDQEVLKRIGRPFDQQRFEGVISAIRDDHGIDIELIMGLPGDRPESFRKTVEKAIELGDAVRIAFCMILPDALLDRARPSDGIEFDTETFLLQSCNGWSAETLAREWEWVHEVAGQHYQQEIGGSWVGFRTQERGRFEERFPERRVPELRQERPAEIASLPAATVERLQKEVAQRVDDFRLCSLRNHDGRVSADLDGPKGDVTLRATRANPEGRYFVRRDGIDYSHQGEVGREGAKSLRHVIDVLHSDVRLLLEVPGELIQLGKTSA
ncbi:MAG: radical SAM protein [Myxococcota bacterium]